MHDGAAERVRSYTRMCHGGIPVYVDPERPDWFIPSERSDSVLRLLVSGISVTEAALQDSGRHGLTCGQSAFLIERFLSRLAAPQYDSYTGRQDRHVLKRLNECWFHLSDRCNMSCLHCMFSSGPAARSGIRKKDAVKLLNEAAALGCRVFYFTGGEPLIYDGFTDVCREALKHAEAHAVILTNGKDLQRHGPWLEAIDRERIHFQISLDGTAEQHDAVRGAGEYEHAVKMLGLLRKAGCNCTLAMSVSGGNVDGMEGLVKTAAACGVRNVHYLWCFQKGKGRGQPFASAGSIVAGLRAAKKRADAEGVLIDNIEILKSQVFSLPGTRYDLSNAGWQSLAVGPDGMIYPTPAMVGEKGMAAGHSSDGLERVWRSSPVLKRVRRASLVDHPDCPGNPLRFLTGGGDIDHSFIHSGELVGHDPYEEVYGRMALFLMAEEGRRYASGSGMAFRLRMGERLYECDEDMGASAFTHSNCVLSLPGRDGHTLVREFYSAAASEPNEEILNPVQYDEHVVAHIPREARVRSYGCGSPVMDCGLRPGETVVDLGSGTGVECFIAASKVGRSGSVTGIDMEDAMLAIAEKSGKAVAENLGYDVVGFRKAFLEDLPFDSGTVDAVISNCVINLSPDKRRTLSEVFRIMKPGGRLFVSDIVCDGDIPIDIRYSERLRGECIGGAFRQNELFGLLGDVGFSAARIEKRFPYRQVRGHAFYSMTYSAWKPGAAGRKSMVYRGPFAAAVTESGTLLLRGARTEVDVFDRFPMDASVLALDRSGRVTNIEQTDTCDCCAPAGAAEPAAPAGAPVLKRTSGCMVCGAEIVYELEPQRRTCFFCGTEIHSGTRCQEGHFVCDRCHAADAIAVIKNVCMASRQSDMLTLMKTIRSHASFAVHGPEHHALVPAVILAAYRNSGGALSGGSLLLGIERGAAVPGGACAFTGTCGAAVGVGIAFSVILEADPLTAGRRRDVQLVTARVLEKIASYKAARCCQRECFIALQGASELSRKYLGIKLHAEDRIVCRQHEKNRECIRGACPLWDKRADQNHHRQ